MRTSLLAPLAVVVWLASTSYVTSAEPIRLQSGPAATQLLELYSSEGCSSCPPAETWLSRLKTDPKLWKDFVPVAFHVDYWDYLGWKDPFASKEHSDRQRDYAAQWRSDSVYTPGFVLNGKEWRGWSHRDAPAGGATKVIGVLTAVSKDGRQWKIEFQPVAENTVAKYEFHAALLGFDLITDVKAGENRGRKVQHDFVVLANTKVEATKDGRSFQGTLSLDGKTAFSPKRLGLAAWVTSAGSLPPVQATGGWVPATLEKPRTHSGEGVEVGGK